ncbi:MAG: hypothetical protein R3C12_08860 [Planctomycetaceae bacterium]
MPQQKQSQHITKSQQLSGFAGGRIAVPVPERGGPLAHASAGKAELQESSAA